MVSATAASVSHFAATGFEFYCYCCCHISRPITPAATISCAVTATTSRAVPRPDQDGEQLFDKVLCDVPCSSDGTLRKAVHIGRKWHVNASHELHRLQAKLVRHALALVKVGGLVVYSTCSLNPLENESVVSATLQLGNVELVDLAETPLGEQLKSMPGLTSWKVTYPAHCCTLLERHCSTTAFSTAL